MKYGVAPYNLGEVQLTCNEMLFYQYLPIKLIGASKPLYEKRLQFLNDLVGKVCCDYIGTYGLNTYINSYVYLTVKHQYQTVGCPFNREGWHSDGFLTDDINYIWSNANPTIFSIGNFTITADDKLSILEMREQAECYPLTTYADNTLLRLDQYNIHKVNDISNYEGMRTFVKISFSKDRYNLIGNSHNYELDYEWEMKPRCKERNIPQK